ncbi:TMEM175 family protein [uncultured Methanobrevibacter sp.]|uniref:TMEM175 family protein n=1 Tax=uncultured Methanobrevibacter sp. TaxID=253161 RepID=UPI0025F84676|nr:TMEM175 family protein [uncultured Methanobrevibacter sp.]
MNTNRFETFFDAILAIIITVLALKLTQPAAPTLDAFLSLNARFITYAICYLVIFIIWYDNHNLFQVVEEIDNRVLAVYALQIFAISLLPYFASWLAFNVDSIPAETMFGIDFLAIDILYILSIYSVYRANPYNCGLSNDNFKSFYKYIPIAIMLLGFIITYTGFPQGIYVCVLISVVIWLIFSRLKRPDNGNTDRFEAFIDAIIAIIITIIVLDIPMVANGTWDAFFDIKFEFIVYAISFLVCFNFWNFNNNIFNIVNKISHRVIWTIGVALFFLSLIPYLTTFVGLNPDSFFPSFLYGLNFMIMAILAIGNARELKNSDPANIALQVALSDNKPFVVTIICVIIGMIIAYFTYPLIIVVACLVSLFFTWAFTFFRH